MLNDDVLRWIKELNQEYFIVVCVGGGTQINEAFAAAGLPVREFGPLGRETDNLKEKQLARDILEKNQAEIQDRLADLGIHASVVIPVIEVGTVLCHVNGDQFILAAYHGFDVLYVVTTKDRVEKKKSFFAPYKKIQVIGF
jgi:acetylglutamate kinase